MIRKIRYFNILKVHSFRLLVRLIFKKKFYSNIYFFFLQVRVCHDDRDYYSYTEIPIECISGGNPSKEYNLVQAAFVGKPGSFLAKDLGVTAQDDVLFAVFSESDSSEGDITSKPNKNSALCVYSLKSIRRKFMQNIQRCFTGK